MGIFSKIFGTDEVIKSGIDLIDEAFYTDSEEAEDKRKASESKAIYKIKLLEAYHPFRTTQRYLALMFSGVFLFIMINGILGSLYGVMDMTNVKQALDFANEMWLGQIVLSIIIFYFNSGTIKDFVADRKAK